MEKQHLEIFNVNDGPYIKIVRTLFKDYEAAIDTSLCFQSFETELASLPGDYVPPIGCLLLARINGEAAGCVALRKFDQGVGEMKRLFVYPKFRGLGIGYQLVKEVVDRAGRIGYKSLVLDTLPSMRRAIMLYESLGFVETLPYRHNPIAGARYMCLDLEKGFKENLPSHG